MDDQRDYAEEAANARLLREDEADPIESDTVDLLAFAKLATGHTSRSAEWGPQS